MTINTVQETCCREGCNIVFFLEQKHWARLQSSGHSFYCPNGHSQHYTGETDEAKIKRLQNEKAAAQRERDNASTEVSRLNEVNDALQKKLRRKCRKPRAKKVL